MTNCIVWSFEVIYAKIFLIKKRMRTLASILSKKPDISREDVIIQAIKNENYGSVIQMSKVYPARQVKSALKRGEEILCVYRDRDLVELLKLKSDNYYIKEYARNSLFPKWVSTIEAIDKFKAKSIQTTYVKLPMGTIESIIELK